MDSSTELRLKSLLYMKSMTILHISITIFTDRSCTYIFFMTYRNRLHRTIMMLLFSNGKTACILAHFFFAETDNSDSTSDIMKATHGTHFYKDE